MSGSSKIAVVLVLLLGVGIVSYHLLKPEAKDSLAISTPQRQATASPTQAPLNPSPDSDDSSRSGVGDLMSRIRDHIESSSPSDQSVSEEPSQEPIVETARVTPPLDVTANPDARGASTTDEQPEAPSITFSVATDAVHGNSQPDDSGSDVPVSSQARSGNDHSVILAGDTPSIPSIIATREVAPREFNDVPRTYQVQPGDTLATIAVEFYGSQQHWIDIATANPFADPRRLQIGQTLRLPDPDDILDIDSTSTMPPPSQAVIHIIRPGESLYSIAKRYYKNANRWRVIFDANRNVLSSDPDDLQPGTKLMIPPSP